MVNEDQNNQVVSHLVEYQNQASKLIGTIYAQITQNFEEENQKSLGLIAKLQDEISKLKQASQKREQEYQEVEDYIDVLEQEVKELEQDASDIKGENESYKSIIEYLTNNPQLEDLQKSVTKLSIDELDELVIFAQSTKMQKKEAKKQAETCVICLERPRNHILIPCAHMCLCEDTDCIKTVGEKCPLCREKIQNILKVF